MDRKKKLVLAGAFCLPLFIPWLPVTTYLANLAYGLIAALGAAAGISVGYVMLGLPFLFYCWLTNEKMTGSILSPSSVPAMATAENVVEYIAGIRDPKKREALLQLFDSGKRLVMEMQKRPERYPKDRVRFANAQIKRAVERSYVDGCLEASKFRELMSHFFLGELAV
jgi:hypothetical protein